MKGLLNTHTPLWYALDDPRLSATARGLILDPTNDFSVSVASIWEMAIKFSLGKLDLQSPFEDFVAECLGPAGFSLMPIEPVHTSRLSGLPFPARHKDPFDRMIIAQAMVENLPIIGADVAFDAYAVRRIW